MKGYLFFYKENNVEMSTVVACHNMADALLLFKYLVILEDYDKEATCAKMEDFDIENQEGYYPPFKSDTKVSKLFKDFVPFSIRNLKIDNLLS